MKRAISISIGSSKRDKIVEIELFGEKVHLERRGTDGDLEEAARLYGELDGKVDAFGVGGTDLGFLVGDRWHTLHSIQPLVRFVHKTPVVDGTGYKSTMAPRIVEVIKRQIGEGDYLKRVLIPSGVDRYSLTISFLKAGYECIIGDLMFALGLPFTIKTDQGLRRLASILLPVVGRLPFRWIYPIGEAQEKRTPKWVKYFQWASIIGGDCHYITRYMPDDLEGKIVVTNTTTPEDRELFRQSGVKYLVNTTPIIDGRSFGTNMMEAALVAAMGRKEPVDYSNPGNYLKEMEQAIDRSGIMPQIQEL